MAAEISSEEVLHVAKLARLELGEEELASYALQLSAVLEHVEAVRRLDTSSLAATSHPLELTNVLRDDELVPCLERAVVLAEAPAVEEHRFKVPRIIGEAP